MAGKGWKTAALAELGQCVSGGTPDTNNVRFWNGSIHWCTPSEVVSLPTRFINSTERTITEEGLRKSSAVMIPAGSLLVCTRATIGDCAINRIPIATNQGFKNLIPNGKVDVEYLYYVLTAKKHELMRLANGSTFCEVHARDFARLPIPLPLMREQKAIAKAFTTWDDQIDKIRGLISAKLRLKRGLMQQLLTGKRRFGEFLKSREKIHTRFGRLPGGDVADGVVKSVRRYVTNLAIDDGKTCVCPKDQLILVSRTGVGKLALAPFDVAVSQDISVLELDHEHVLPLYAFYSISNTVSNMQRYNQGTSIRGIKRNDLLELRIDLPSIAEQRKIAAVLSAADTETNLLRRKLELLKKQKRGLMQKLLTGKVRVKV